MAIVKRLRKDGSAAWQVVLSHVDPVTRKRVRTVIGTTDTKREAMRMEREAKSSQDAGRLVARSELTVANLLHSWLATKKGTVRSNTYEGYRRAVKNHVEPALGLALVQSITPINVQETVNRWKDEGQGVRTITTSYRVLKAAYDYAVKMHLVIANPCKGVTLPKETEPRVVPIWTEAEYIRFLAEADKDRYKELWYLLTEGGLRIGEALGAPWTMMQWDANILLIGDTAVPDQSQGGKMVIQPWGKTDASRRGLLLSDNLTDMLRERRKKNMHTVLIFESIHGNPLSHAILHRHLKKLCKAAKVDPVRIHDLRHLAATRMMRARVPETIAQKRMGHGNSEVLRKIYQHADVDMQRDAVASLVALTKANADQMLTGETEGTENTGTDGHIEQE